MQLIYENFERELSCWLENLRLSPFGYPSALPVWITSQLNLWTNKTINLWAAEAMLSRRLHMETDHDHHKEFWSRGST